MIRTLLLLFICNQVGWLCGLGSSDWWAAWFSTGAMARTRRIAI